MREPCSGGIRRRSARVASLEHHSTGQPRLGFPPLTEAMVNVRATLDAAVDAGLLAQQERAVLCYVAKSLFYKNRTWDRILAIGGAAGVTADALARFAEWRVANSVDLKRRDARLLIEAMLNRCRGLVGCRIRPTLNRTRYWVMHEDRFGLHSDDEDGLERYAPPRETFTPSR